MTRIQLIIAASVVALGSGCSLLAVVMGGRADGLPALASRMGLAWVFATIAVAGSIVIHRHRILVDARGRSAAAPRGARWTKGAGSTAMWLFVIAIVLATAIELVALARAEPLDLIDADRATGRSLANGGDSTTNSTSNTDPLETSGQSSRGGLVGPDPDRPSGGSEARPDGLGDLMSSDEVMRVIEHGPRGVLPAGRPLHMRGFVIEGYDASGALRETSEQGRALRGDAVGWIEDPFDQVTRTTTRSPLVRLELQFTVPSRGLVFSPHRLAAVRATSARFDPAQLALYVNGLAIRTIDVWAAPVSLSWDELDADTARDSLPAENPTLALPDRTRGPVRRTALGRLESLARDLTQDAASDLERVVAVVQYARTSFAYELYDTSFLSPERCVELVDRGAGSCTHFVSLATVLLRQLGIPTRVAAGYVARERLDDDSGWRVRERDGHAWIEVHFAEAGWVPFDPTPGGETIGGAESGWSPLEDDPSDDGTQRDTRRTTPLAQMVFDGAAALKGIHLPGGSALHWLTAVFAIGLALFVVARVTGTRRSGGRTTDAHTRAATVARSPDGGSPDASVAELFAALKQRGLRQSDTSTPLEFARRLEERLPEAEGLADVFRSILGSACRARALPDPTRRRIRLLTQRIRGGANRRRRSA